MFVLVGFVPLPLALGRAGVQRRGGRFVRVRGRPGEITVLHGASRECFEPHRDGEMHRAACECCCRRQ